MATTRQRRAGAVTMSVVGVSLLASCVLREGPDYVVQPAPPSGVHVTIKLGPSSMLHAVSDMVSKGSSVDGHLRAYGLPTRCDAYPNTAYYGARCAFDVLGDVEMGGGLAGGIKRLYWNDAVADDEFSDFRNDALARILPKDNTNCLHATIRNYGDWPIEWRETNWTIRTKSDSKCR